MISVVVPIYKVKEELLKECIESIMNQSYSDLEIILIDDGSPDNSGKICDDYSKKDKRIKVIHKENGGVSSARNIGIENANGDWITFVDSDDYIEKDFCKKMLNKAIENKCQCVISAYNKVYGQKIETIKKENDLLINGNEFLKMIFNVQSGFGFCHTKIWKTELIKNNKVKFNETISVGEDALFCMQMSKYIEKLYFLNEPLYNYRFNEESVVRKFDKNYYKKYLKSMQIAKKYIAKEYSSEYEQNVYNYIAYHILLIVINYCFHPQNKDNGVKSLKKICNIEEFKEAIQKSNYEGFSLTRKITLFTLKYKLYFITKIIADIRQSQFKK